MTWDDDIAELEAFYAKTELPKQLRVRDFVFVHDVPLFVASSMETVKAQNGNWRYLPYLTRLKALKRIIENNGNFK